jgi:hypothetical protein
MCLSFNNTNSLRYIIEDNDNVNTETMTKLTERDNQDTAHYLSISVHYLK